MKKCFTPIQLGNLTLKNRFMMAPMENGLAAIGGGVTDKLCDFFAERAKTVSYTHLDVYKRQDRDILEREIYILERQCAETFLTLRQKLCHSKGATSQALAETYEKVESQLQHTQDALKGLVKESDDPPEEITLLAEYALDFALQAADRALLLSMKAIFAQQASEKEERKYS